MPVHISVLQQFSLLRQLPTSALQALAAVAGLETFARRQVVLDKSQPSQALHFLLEGRLQATDFTLDGKEVVLSFVDEGDYFGEVSMLDGLPNPETMIASRKSVVVQVPAQPLRPWILDTPVFAAAITQGLVRRVRQQSLSRQILSISNPLQRVCAQLLSLARQAEPHPQCPEVALRDAPTHQELALMVNLSRETVTRVFQSLQARQAVQRQSDALTMHVPTLTLLAQPPEATGA